MPRTLSVVYVCLVFRRTIRGDSCGEFSDRKVLTMCSEFIDLNFIAWKSRLNIYKDYKVIWQCLKFWIDIGNDSLAGTPVKCYFYIILHSFWYFVNLPVKIFLKILSTIVCVPWTIITCWVWFFSTKFTPTVVQPPWRA